MESSHKAIRYKSALAPIAPPPIPERRRIGFWVSPRKAIANWAETIWTKSTNINPRSTT